MLAEIYLLDGKPRAAVDAATRALSHSRQEKTELLAALIYAEAGETAKAEAVAAGMEAKLVPEPQAYARLIRGEIERKRGHAPEAVRLFQEAQKQADTWLGRFHLGRAYLDAGAFAEADSDFEVCLKRRGEAAAAFLDDVPTYRYLPPVHYYLGRAKEGLKSPGAADSYRTFLAIKEKGDGDPLVADARRRISAR
jgi:tetratricopeptide (TPR) repeat protein